MTGMLRLAAMLLAGLLLLTACGDDQPQSADGEATVASNRVVAQVAPVAVVTPQPSAPGDGWAAYVSEQSASPLSRHGRIRLLFSADLVAEGEVGQLRPDLLLSEPAIAGQVSFVSPRELVLIPDQPLPAGQRYQFTLQRAALPRLPASLDDYQFQLEVMNQSYALQLAELEVLGAASERVSVKGNITTSDEASSAAIVGSLSASLDGQPLQANWRHAGKGRQHSFVFADIVRGDVPRQLQLRWDAQGLGVASTGERQITIPPRHAFQLLRLMAQGPAGEPDSIRIEFSDLLDEKQNLDGLIALSSGAFTQRIDGNSLLLYPAQRPRGAVTVTLEAGIKSFQGRALAAQSSSSVYFPPAKPQLRFVDQGVILPASEQLSVPFEAVNVTAVQVTAFRVYEHNIGQFLQVNNLAGSSELARVGRYLWSKRVVLGDTKADQWQRFAVDLSQLFAEHPGALIRLSLNVSRSDVRYDCGDAATPVPPQVEPLSSNGPDESGSSGWDGIESWYYSDSNERNDPCHDSYYQSHSNSRASNSSAGAHSPMRS